MAFDGISTDMEATGALARVARRTTDADRGILNRGLPNARVRKVDFDPASRVVILQLDNGEQVRVAARYDGKPNPGVYTFRRAVHDVHDGTAFAPDRPMGGTPNRDGYVIAFDAPRRATLAGVQEFTVAINGASSRAAPPRALSLRPDARVPDAMPPAVAGGSTPKVLAFATMKERLFPELGPLSTRGIDNRLLDNRSVENRGTSPINPGLEFAPQARPNSRMPAAPPSTLAILPELPLAGAVQAYRLSLDQRLADYLKKERRPDPIGSLSGTVSRGGDVLIIGSYHKLREDTSLLEERLLRSGKFQYYGSEEFINTGQRRQDLDKILTHGWKNPPTWILPFERVIRAAMAGNVRILTIGHLTDDVRKRDGVLADHVFKQWSTAISRQRSRGNATVLLSLGGHHAAKTPLLKGPKKTTRMLLQEKGFRIVTAFFLSDRLVTTEYRKKTYEVRADAQAARVDPKQGPDPSQLIDLAPAMAPTTVVPLRKQSPFAEITMGNFATRASLVDAFDYLVLRRI